MEVKQMLGWQKELISLQIYSMAQIFIKIDKSFYFAGDTIQGEVYLCLYEPMNANEVLIKFKGWEEAKWLEERNIISEEQKARIPHHLCWGHNMHIKMDTTDSSSEQGEQQWTKYRYVRMGNQVKQVYKRTGGRIIVRTTNVLHNFGGQYIAPGQYVFPFSYKTSQSFPATFVNKSSDRKSKGRIKYEMRVFVRGFTSRRRLLKHSTQIVVRQTNVIQNQQKEMQAHVKSCCCIDKGISKIKCYFDKNGYMPGEQAKIYCILDNRGCVADITRVTVKLINHITYISKDNFRKNFDIQIFRNDFPGLPAGDEAERDKTVTIINSDGNKDPRDIMPTARGQRVKSVYVLRVEAELNASCTCCSNLPVVEQPIVIYPYVTSASLFQTPSNWHPLMMPMVNLQKAISVTNEKLNSMQNPYY